MRIKIGLIALIFFILGAVAVFIYQGKILKTKAEDYQEIGSAPSSTPIPTKIIIPTPTIVQTNSSQTGFQAPAPSSKLTILESRKITANRTLLETGETVDFAVALKNIGTKAKSISHICFHHSGGVTFGCLRDIYLPAGEEFPFNNTMIFTDPGTYSVWIDWSQDGVNFYRPINGGAATVTVE